MTLFFSRLSYSFGNEDWRTEERALQLKSGDHVLCITASGDRPLNLLHQECKKIVCIDANPIQNYLLQLKISAMKCLNYRDYLAFLGAIPGAGRLQTLQKLLPEMDKEAAQFWSEHKKMIEKGVLYQGAVERLTKILATCANIVRGKKIKRLFAMDDLGKQRQFIDQEWDSRLWRKIFEYALKPFFTRFIIEDPGLINVGSSINPGIYLYERINASLRRDLAKKNLLLSLLLKGEVSKEAFSPYLTEGGTKVIRPRLNRLETRTTDVVEYLESLSGPTFDAFSVSDVISYMNENNFVRLLRAIVKTAKPGARFCLRQFLSSHQIPDDLQPFFVRDHAIEKELEDNDNCFVYRFWVGAIDINSVNQEVPAFVDQAQATESALCEAMR